MTIRQQEQSLRATSRLIRQGFDFADRPEQSMPNMPTDVTSIPDPDLMDLWAQCNAWLDFAAVQVASAEVDERSAERALAQTQATVISEGSSAPKRSVTAAKAEAVADQRVVDAQLVLDTCYAYRKMAGTIKDRLERQIALLSRELTRRTSQSSWRNS